MLVPEQATQQLGPAWTLMRAGTPGCPEIPDWLAQNLPESARVGIDPYLHTVQCPLQKNFSAVQYLIFF